MTGGSSLPSGPAALQPSSPDEVALARATVAENIPDDTGDRRAVLDVLGLDLEEGGPRVRLADLENRPDRELAARRRAEAGEA